MDLIQINGQPRFGRFSIVPSMINIDRYEHRVANGNILKGWRKRLQYKKYKFCFIQHENITIGLAIADMVWASYGYFYIYHHDKKEVFNWNAVNLLSRKTVLDEQPLFNQSYFENSPYQIQIQHANGVRYIQVTKFGEIQLSARIFCAGTQPLSVCKPYGETGWIYTQKLMTLNCEGYFIDKQGELIQFNDKTFAALSDTCGFLSPNETLFTLSSNYWDRTGNRIGLYLTSNKKHDDSNENCLWINGQLYALPKVNVTQIQPEIWHIHSDDKLIDLSLNLNWHRSEGIKLHLKHHQTHQWQVKVSGKIQHEELNVLLLDEYGLFEQYKFKE
ncbi:DUF2804 family protein [Acinetobacter equi]|uniref:DUF2804 domain-containing protein n=1 Tax=Acinetobacter equi TaxID=1324350 RepID=A0A0N9VVS6_9GAMM|nr:DUF2804 family protein [Acinetobacter equi]ALH95240.1 hypothetical protein AOY20_06630 [Acinetobacter equi]